MPGGISRVTADNKYCVGSGTVSVESNGLGRGEWGGELGSQGIDRGNSGVWGRVRRT